ncbi:MAG: T9SS type A sorting domain-containing protein [Ginsengibacter sp.]
MKHIFTKILGLTILAFSSTITFSQSKEFNYLSSGLSTSACNVFNPAVIVTEISHSSHAGGVTFNSSNGLILTTTPKLSSPGATAFVINYSFNPGYKYDISITAKGNSAMLLKSSVVPNLNQFNTNGTTSCTPDNYAFSYITAGYGQFTTPTSASSTSYSIPQFIIPGNNIYPYMIVWVSGGRPNLELDALSISKINIIETASPSFTLASSPSLITCGSTSSITFTTTANNVPGGSSVSYTWNLGATPNGWLYNGSPAPISIPTGTVNTLSLTPDCGKPLSSIYATATLNSVNYSTNNSTVSVISPSLTIEGNPTLCSGTDSYNIPNLPCNATVSWNSSNISIATVTPTGNPATVTKAGNGEVKITATINACGVSLPPISKTIIVGIPQYTYEIVPSPISSYTECYKLNKTYSFTIQPTGTDPYYPNGPYRWYCTGMGILSSTTKTVSIKFTQAGDYTLSVRPNSACGLGPASVYGETLHASSSCSGGYYLVSPNPVKSDLSITSIMSKQMDNSTSSERPSIRDFDRVEIIDKSGNIVVRKTYSKNTRNANLNISNLRSDVYIIRIFHKNTSEEHKIIVQK